MIYKKNDLKKQGIFFFDPGDPIYSDHFPGNPIVPGSLIVHAFMTACRQDQPVKLCEVLDFRFKQFLSPGEYVYEIHGVEAIPGKWQISCRLFDDDRPVVTGKLIYDHHAGHCVRRERGLSPSGTGERKALPCKNRNHDPCRKTGL